MKCNCCEAGFKNFEQVPEHIAENYCASGDADLIRNWMKENESDVCICDCCGDGDDWYGVPGLHYAGGDHIGKNGPYVYNGGLPECS